MNSPLQIIMIDNYDSFTYNLVNQFRQIGAEVIIFRNDTPIEAIFTTERLENDNTIIVISPGPGNPESAGNSLEIIAQFAGRLPILGICLGHQSIVHFYGGTIGYAKQVVHGKADNIYVNEDGKASGLFDTLPDPFRAARYHSLAGTQIPDDLLVVAHSENEVMAVQHVAHKVLGFQFHPESILTTHGGQLLSASIRWLTNSTPGTANINRQT